MEAPQQTKTTKYEHIIPQITAVEESEEIDGLLVLLNTVGGDVEAGLAIAELIARAMRKPTVVRWSWGAGTRSACRWRSPPSARSSRRRPR